MDRKLAKEREGNRCDADSAVELVKGAVAILGK